MELDRIGADYMELVRMKVGCTEADCREAVHTEPTINGNRIPAPAPKFGGVIKENVNGLQDLVAAARRAAQGRAQHSAHPDR